MGGMGGGPGLDQTDFDHRKDDASESAAVGLSLNTDWNQLVDENVRVRFVIDHPESSPESRALFLRYSHEGGAFTVVDGSSSVVRSSLSSQFADDDDTTQQIGSGSFITPNGCMDELDGQTPTVEWVSNDEVEVEFCFQIRSADVTEGDTVDLRVYTTSGQVLRSYVVTPRMFVGPVKGVSTSGVTGVAVILAFASNVRIGKATLTGVAVIGPAIGHQIVKHGVVTSGVTGVALFDPAIGSQIVKHGVVTSGVTGVAVIGADGHALNPLANLTGVAVILAFGTVLPAQNDIIGPIGGVPVRRFTDNG